jgi:hypothetical protein
MAVERQWWLWTEMAVASNSSPVITIPCTVTLVIWRLEKNCKSCCYHSPVECSAFVLHAVCCLLSAQSVSCGWEGFPQSVSTRRPGVDMDANVSYLASESRYSGTGSLPQSSTSTRYGYTPICSDITHIAQGRYNDYWYICVYLQFGNWIFYIKIGAHYKHTHMLHL